MRALLTACLLFVAAPALAQSPAGQAAAPPAEFAPPDPNAWWTDVWPKLPEAADPLGGRRARRGERPVPVDPGISPDLYRLWGLQPLQIQLVRRNEMILEAWARPSVGVRQAVIRLTVRGDGDAFVQARAGLGCCEPQIQRRVMVNEALPAGWTERLRGLITDPAWAQPRTVVVDEGDGSSTGVCVDGVSWDVTLVVPGEARHLRRACDPAQVGSIANLLEAAVGAALGHDPRIDVVFPGGADFAAARRDYQALLARGGTLRAAPNTPAQPAPIDVAPEPAGPDPAEAATTP